MEEHKYKTFIPRMNQCVEGCPEANNRATDADGRTNLSIKKLYLE